MRVINPIGIMALDKYVRDAFSGARASVRDGARTVTRIVTARTILQKCAGQGRLSSSERHCERAGAATLAAAVES